ncbi:MAG: arylsulfatase [Verrucomicrobiota bacterium]
MRLPIACCFLIFTTALGADPGARPNIVYILADDLGINDFGCYGQEIMKTPRIDQMAAEGMQFFNHYSGSTVCAPTRSCLMTGQHTGRTRVRGNGPAHLMPQDVTVAELLQRAGYKTACIGKWGLGEANSGATPNEEGFDYFFGYLNQSRAHRFYPDWVWRNFEKIEYSANPTKRDVYIHDEFTKEALGWISESAESGDPFFLYLAYTLSHVDLDVPDESIEPYLDVIEEEGPYENPKFPEKGYRSHPTPRACFAGMTSRLDRDVGRLLDHLDALGLGENTVVFFSSDNGPTSAGGADPDFFDGNGIYRGIKRDLYEGGIRVPLLARWPGKIEAGSRSNHISAHWDFLATAAEIAGIEPSADHTGISFAPTLRGDSAQAEHEYLLWEFYEKGGKQAIRKGDWKGVRLQRHQNPDGAWELYDLANDPGETRNLAEEHPEWQTTFNDIVAEASTENEFFQWKKP